MSFDKKSNLESPENQSINIDLLLDSLSKDIGKSFGLKEKTIKDLIDFKKDISLDQLKSEISESKNIEDSEKEKIKNINIEKLFFTLKGAKEVIEKASSNKLNILKKELDSSSIENFNNSAEEYLPKNLVEAAKQGGTIHKKFLGIALGTINTIYKTTEALFMIGKGLLNMPYHLYLIFSGKGEYTGFKNI